MYGPRQFGGEDHGWVANFTIKNVIDHPIKIFGTSHQVRDILYVLDAARAFYNWYIAGSPSGTYNIGGGLRCTISIQNVLDFLAHATGNKPKINLLPARHGDLWWFISDCQKAQEAFGWEPTILPNEGLKVLLSWVENERSLFE
jgi:CDP-paratose 2-epimerase